MNKDDRFDMCLEEIQLKRMVCMKQMLEAQTCENCGIRSAMGNTCQHCGFEFNGNIKSNKLMKDFFSELSPIIGRMDKIDPKRSIDYVRQIRSVLTKLGMDELK